MYPDHSYLGNTDIVSCCHGNNNRQPICSLNGEESVDLTWDIEKTLVTKETRMACGLSSKAFKNRIFQHYSEPL